MKVYLFEMDVFLSRIGVIEPHDELPFESLLIILVEKCRFGVTYV